MKGFAKKLFALAIAGVLACGLAACGPTGTGGGGGGGGDNDELTEITLIGVGSVNTPVNAADDPFQDYLAEKFGIHLKMQMYDAANFETQLSVSLASSQKPDIIYFQSLASFEKYYNDGSLVDDWGPWKDQLPTMMASMQENENALKRITAENGNPRALFGNVDETWGVKVRQDWLNEYAAAKNKMPAAGDYVLKDSDDMLDFARWIRDTKNEAGETIKTFAFSSAGTGTQIGTSIEWTQGLFGHTINGLSNEPARGFYITDEGTVSNPIIDGSYEEWLEFLRTLVQEQLIAPNWFTQDWTAKATQARTSSLAFEYYPGALVQELYWANRTDEETNFGRDCFDWFKNIQIPANEGNEFVGHPRGINFGHIWTVSYATSMNPTKMNKICKLLNDIVITYDETKTDKTYYDRPETYDVLRWGEGILDGIEFIDVEGSKYVACDTQLDDLAEGEINFRSENPGAWDYGAWISTSNDGVAQTIGKDQTAIDLAVIIGEMNDGSRAMDGYQTVGSIFVYDNQKLTKMFDEYVKFTYEYATAKEGEVPSVASFITRWRTELEGDKMIEEAEKQFREQGYLQ